MIIIFFCEDSVRQNYTRNFLVTFFVAVGKHYDKKQFIGGKALIKFKGYSKSLNNIRKDTQQKLEATSTEEQR